MQEKLLWSTGAERRSNRRSFIHTNLTWDPQFPLFHFTLHLPDHSVQLSPPVAVLPPSNTFA